MSERLQELLIETVIRMGRGADAALAAEAKVSVDTLRKLKAGRPVGVKSAYRIALACGCSDAEALALARGGNGEARTA